jgi:hypothetical protein
MLSIHRAAVALSLSVIGFGFGSGFGVRSAFGATPLAYEGFDYTPSGTLLSGKNGGTGSWSSAWAEFSSPPGGPDDTVDTAGLTYQNLPTTGGYLVSTGDDSDDTRSFNSGGATTLYFSFLLRRDSTGSLGATGDYGGVAIDGTSGVSFFIGDPGENNFLSIGRAGTGTGLVSSSTTLVEDEIAFLVGRIIMNTGSGEPDFVRLYINPTPGTDEFENLNFIDKNDLNIGVGFTGIQVLSGFDAAWSFDEISIGDTFAAVAAPEPASLAVMGIGAGMMLIRGRRRG